MKIVVVMPIFMGLQSCLVAVPKTYSNNMSEHHFLLLTVS